MRQVAATIFLIGTLWTRVAMADEASSAPSAPAAPAPELRSSPQADDVEAPSRPIHQPPPPPLPSAPSPLGETGIGVLQALTGLLVMDLSLIPSFASLHSGGEATFLAALIPGPAFGGWIVCAIGRGSSYFGGSCGPAVVGAYVGAVAAAIPLAYVVAKSDMNGDGLGALIGFFAGYTLGATVGAMVGWHAFKRPRHELQALAAPAPPLRAADWPELRRTEAGSALAHAPGVRVTVPLLALSF